MFSDSILASEGSVRLLVTGEEVRVDCGRTRRSSVSRNHIAGGHRSQQNSWACIQDGEVQYVQQKQETGTILVSLIKYNLYGKSRCCRIKNMCVIIHCIQSISTCCKLTYIIYIKLTNYVKNKTQKTKHKLVSIIFSLKCIYKLYFPSKCI